MSSYAVPKKLANYSEAISGLKTIIDINPEIVNLLPLNASVDSKFSHASNRVVLFKIPSYSSTVMDTSKSHISFDFLNTSTAQTGGATNFAKLVLGTGSLFNRVIVKSEGVVIQDSDNVQYLNKIITLMETKENQPSSDEGNYDELLGGLSTASTVTTHNQLIGKSQMKKTNMIYRFNHGIFSKHLKSYLPIGWVGRGGTAFEVQLFLSDPSQCMMSTQTTAPTETLYEISNVQWVLSLLKLNESLSAKFNSLSQSGSAIKIPYTTYTSQSGALYGKSSTIFVSDSTTDISSVICCIVPNNPPATDPLQMLGSHLGDTNGLASHNFTIGNKRLYNEDVLAGAFDNTSAQEMVKFGSKHSKKMFLEHLDPVPVTKDSVAFVRPLYETKGNFFTLANFRYTTDDFLCGVNLGSLPLRISKTCTQTAWSDSSIRSFVEANFTLIIQDGRASFVEIAHGKEMTSFSY